VIRDAEYAALRVPDQPDPGDARRPLESDRHPRHYVRESSALRGPAKALRGRNRFQHPGESAAALGLGRAAVASGRPDSQAKGNLQPYRDVHTTGPFAGSYGSLGTTAHASFQTALSPGTVPRGGWRTDVASLHGGTARHSSWRPCAPTLGMRRTPGDIRVCDQTATRPPSARDWQGIDHRPGPGLSSRAPAPPPRASAPRRYSGADSPAAARCVVASSRKCRPRRAG